MDITTRPRRVPIPAWFLGVTTAAILAPVVALVVLPTILGLDRYVLEDRTMAGSLTVGSVLLNERVAHSDLAVGDVITFRPPTGAAGERSDTLVTRRIVDIDGQSVTTRGDAASADDPWIIDQRTYPSVSRVVVAVPWVGGLIRAGDTWVWLALTLTAGTVLAFILARDRPGDAAPRPTGRPLTSS